MPHVKTQLTTLALTLALAGGAVAAPLDEHPVAAERVDARLARLTERLDLSEAQQVEIRALLDAHHQAADRERARLREQIDAVLTEAQRARRADGDRTMVERRLARMAERLDLSDAQRTEVAAILAEHRNAPGMSREALRERMAAVLTASQRGRLRDLLSRPGRRPGGAGPWAD